MVPIKASIVGLAALASRVSGLIAGICILAIALSVSYEVVLRALFNAPTEWVNEVSVYLVLISAFLGFAPALAAGKHINVDLVTSKLSARTNRLLKILCSVLGLGFSLVFLVTSAEMTLNSYELGLLSTSTLRVPLYIPQLSMPIGFAVLTLQFLANLLDPDAAAAVADKEAHG